MKQTDKPFKLEENANGYLTVGVKDHYKAYKLSEKNNKELSYQDWKDVIEFLFITIWAKIFKENWIFKAPHHIGQFYVAQVPGSKGFFKDWKKTSEKGEVVKKYNIHTNGRKYFIKWCKILTRMPNQTRYAFKPYRGSAEEFTGKRGLAYWIKHCSEDPYLQDFKGHLI